MFKILEELHGKGVRITSNILPQLNPMRYILDFVKK